MSAALFGISVGFVVMGLWVLVAYLIFRRRNRKLRSKLPTTAHQINGPWRRGRR